MRKKMLSKIHSTHLGTDACKRRAKAVLFWNAMNNEIKQVCDQCDICAEFLRKNQKEPLMTYELPTRPW